MVRLILTWYHLWTDESIALARLVHKALAMMDDRYDQSITLVNNATDLKPSDFTVSNQWLGLVLKNCIQEIYLPQTIPALPTIIITCSPYPGYHARNVRCGGLAFKSSHTLRDRLGLPRYDVCLYMGCATPRCTPFFRGPPQEYADPLGHFEETRHIDAWYSDCARVCNCTRNWGKNVSGENCQWVQSILWSGWVLRVCTRV